MYLSFSWLIWLLPPGVLFCTCTYICLTNIYWCLCALLYTRTKVQRSWFLNLCDLVISNSNQLTNKRNYILLRLVFSIFLWYSPHPCRCAYQVRSIFRCTKHICCFKVILISNWCSCLCFLLQIICNIC